MNHDIPQWREIYDPELVEYDRQTYYPEHAHEFGCPRDPNGWCMNNMNGRSCRGCHETELLFEETQDGTVERIDTVDAGVPDVDRGQLGGDPGGDAQ